MGTFTRFVLSSRSTRVFFSPYFPAVSYQKSRIIPSSYLFSLDGFVAAKEESINVVEETSGTDHGRLTALYAQQRRYIASLLNQLPPDVSHTSETSPVYVNSCLAGKRSATRQGPFLLQPAPRLLGQDVDDTTDILYVLAGGLPDATIKGWKRPIGMLLIANQDGRIDVCLDLDKVEAQWDTKVGRYRN
jgi:nucleoporin NUP82